QPAIVDAVVAAMMAQMETLDLVQADAVDFAGDPLVLTMKIATMWERIRSTENRIALAAQEAAAERIPTALAAASPRLRRCYQILARLQRMIGDAAVHPGQRQLARELGCTQQTVSGFLAVFERVGLLTVVDAHYAPGRRAKAYRVRLEAR